ncbi:hypothetical protein [Catenulispora subtropica]
MVNTDYPANSQTSAAHAGYGLGFRRRASAAAADAVPGIHRQHR